MLNGLTSDIDFYGRSTQQAELPLGVAAQLAEKHWCKFTMQWKCNRNRKRATNFCNDDYFRDILMVLRNPHRKTDHLFCKSDIQNAEHNVTARREDSPEGMLLPAPLERNIRQSYTSDVVHDKLHQPHTSHLFMKHRDTESSFHVTIITQIPYFVTFYAVA